MKFFSIFEVLSYDHISISDIRAALHGILPNNFFDVEDEILNRLKIEATYATALEQQFVDIEQLKKEQSLKFPLNFNFSE